jgi:hypothetical protein
MLRCADRYVGSEREHRSGHKPNALEKIFTACGPPRAFSGKVDAGFPQKMRPLLKN